MMPTRIRLHSETASLTITLLAVIIVTGLMLTLVATVLTGQKRVQHNRAYHEAITGAEAAVNQAVTFLSTLDVSDERTLVTSDDLPADAQDALTVGDAEFSWEARRLGPIAWVVRGTGDVDDVERTLEVLASRESTFYLAAFADVGFRMIGANDARSYNSTSVDTGAGAIGSNGTIDMRGNAYADAIYLMGNATCDTNACDPDLMVGFPDEYDMEELRAFIQGQMDVACPSGGDAPVSYAGQVLTSGDYCFTSIITGNSQDIVVNATSEAPARVFVTGDIEFGRHSDVNCPAAGCSAAVAPDAGALQVYSTGASVRIGNQAALAAAIGAPNATCVGNPSNAQAEIYGAIVCNDLSNQGGWDFWYDERLLNLGGGFFRMTNFNEEVGGSTSFPVAQP